jgi:hypothetical protein
MFAVVIDLCLSPPPTCIHTVVARWRTRFLLWEKWGMCEFVLGLRLHRCLLCCLDGLLVACASQSETAVAAHSRVSSRRSSPGFIHGAAVRVG